MMKFIISRLIILRKEAISIKDIEHHAPKIGHKTRIWTTTIEETFSTGIPRSNEA